ncbi:hypothetical protein MTP03_45430 [Tsukamurella sp. PLM1]|nr:hypothetical protein MTP03_45430 [Tsukamurella sp. PLM1]
MHLGGRLAVGPKDNDADGFYQKRMMRGAPPYAETVTITFPSGRTADELCPTEPAIAVWCAQMGTITFHPWPVRRGDVDRPDELRIDLDPQPGTDFRDVVRVAGVARELAEELGLRAYCKTSGNRGVHVFVRIAPRWDFVEVRHAAIAFGRELERRDSGVTTAWWKEERGADLRGLQPEQSRPHHGLRVVAACRAGRHRLHAAHLGSARGAQRPARAQPVHRARSAHRRRPVGRYGRRGARPDAPTREMGRAPRRAELPARLPQDARRTPRVQPSKKVAEHWDADGNRIE